MCAKLSVEFDVELKWRFGVQLNGSLVAMVASLWVAASAHNKPIGGQLP
jgi:hypothetical protein